jgi:hypothetical protein
LLLRRLDQALPRVVDLASARFELLFEIGAGPASSTNPRLLSGRMKVATARSALRPFARQGHLPRRRDQSASRSFGVGTRSSSSEWRMFLSANRCPPGSNPGQGTCAPPGTRSSHFSYCKAGGLTPHTTPTMPVAYSAGKLVVANTAPSFGSELQSLGPTFASWCASKCDS